MEEKAGCIGQAIGAVVFLAILFWIGGLWRTEVTYVPPNAKAGSAQIPFEEKLNARHWVAGLVKGKQPDLQEALRKHLQEGGELSQLTIMTKYSWADMLLAAVTLGIYTPYTVIIKGSISKP